MVSLFDIAALIEAFPPFLCPPLIDDFFPSRSCTLSLLWDSSCFTLCTVRLHPTINIVPLIYTNAIRPCSVAYFISNAFRHPKQEHVSLACLCRVPGHSRYRNFLLCRSVWYAAAAIFPSMSSFPFFLSPGLPYNPNAAMPEWLARLLTSISLTRPLPHSLIHQVRDHHHPLLQLIVHPRLRW